MRVDVDVVATPLMCPGETGAASAGLEAGEVVLVGRPTEIVLYQAEWCPYCVRVRAKLTELLLDYTNVNVPRPHSERGVVKEVSGQTSIPVLVDGTVVLDDDDEIIPYLERTYGAAAATRR